MQSLYQKLLYSVFFLSAVGFCQAQISGGGTPRGLSSVFQARYALAPIKATILPVFPLQKVLKEDEAATGIRVAAPIKVDLGLQNAGEWLELDNGDRLWRLKIRSVGALGLSALYDDLYLPKGARLFMYREDGSQILGAYTEQSNTPNHTFMTGFVYGDAAILEYYEPKAVRGEGRLHVFRVDHAYKKSGFQEKSALADFGFGASVECNVNINCPQGNSWQKQKRGVCRIIVVVEEGSGYCTGTLINNTKNDGTPYVLSAFHCQEGFTPKYDFWRYDFNYESPNCPNGGGEPAFQSMLGSTLRASRRQNDFLLLELSDTIPPSYNVYLNGWNRNSSPPTSSITIHHPKGDIKKISTDNQMAAIYGPTFNWTRGDGTVIYTSPANHLFRLQLDASTVEIGSSGSALFDQNGRIVGQLHGGTDLGSCTVNAVYYDRFRLAWEGGGNKENRLKDWLAPDSSSATVLNGTELNQDSVRQLTGFVRTSKGEGIGGVSVTLGGGPVGVTTITDTSGAYVFNNIPIVGNFTLSLTKDYSDRNGVSVFDIILISKHILNTQLLDSPLKLLAADVNNSGTVTVLDIIEMRKLILGIDAEFRQTPSWQFISAGFEFFDPQDPWDEFFPSLFQVISLTAPMNFTGYKTGDVDYSADAKN